MKRRRYVLSLSAIMSEISQRSLKCLGQAIERAQTSLVAECRDILIGGSSAGMSGLRVGNRFLGVTKMCNQVLQMKLMLLIMGTMVSPLWHVGRYSVVVIV